MKQRIENLSKIASNLDQRNLSKFATDIDGLSKKYLNIKTAQYVGIQGYWIRNERCWSNCYRQKRAKSPKLSAQQVWSECQNEYVDSMNKIDSDWAKYALDEQPLVKFASGSPAEKVANKIIKSETQYFNKSVAQKVKNGLDYPIAVFDTIYEKNEKYAEAHIDLANGLLKIAEELKEKGLHKTAKQIAVEANEIVKEAQLGNVWDKIKGVGKGIAKGVGGFLGGDTPKWINTLKSNAAWVLDQKNNSALEKFKQEYLKDLPLLQKMVQKDDGLKPILEIVNQIGSQGPNALYQSVGQLSQLARQYQPPLAKEPTKKPVGGWLSPKDQAQQPTAPVAEPAAAAAPAAASAPAAAPAADESNVQSTPVDLNSIKSVITDLQPKQKKSIFTLLVQEGIINSLNPAEEQSLLQMLEEKMAKSQSNKMIK